MPLTMRPFSINTHCISKLLFRCGSVDLRLGDIKKINSDIKSWLFADQLEYPEEIILHRPRASGGLGLLNIKYKAMSEQIRIFLETAINPKFSPNLYHQSLFKWHVENIRDIPEPKKNPYISEEIYSEIKKVKAGGLLNIAKMTSGQWYRVLLESNVTMISDTNQTFKPCRTESKNPQVDWESVWSLANLDGLCSIDKTFLWRMLHNIHPTQERLHRLGMRNAPTPICNHCNLNSIDNLSHSLISCTNNAQVSDWLLKVVRPHVPQPVPAELVLLHLGHIEEDMKLPLVWLIAQVLGQVWSSRKEKKRPQLYQTRAKIEAGIEILRKSRFIDASKKLKTMIEIADR